MRRKYGWGKSSALRSMSVGESLTVEVSDKSDISGWRVTASRVTKMFWAHYYIHKLNDNTIQITRIK
jgi:hypothetical protein